MGERRKDDVVEAGDDEKQALAVALPSPTPAEQHKQVLQLLAYAELRAILVAWAQGSPWNPIDETWLALRRTLEDGLTPGSPPFATRAAELLRDSSQQALEPAMRRGGPWPYNYTIGRGQVGCFAGIESVFDEAGRIAVWHHDGDLRLLRVAIQLFERLQQLMTHPPDAQA
jgi:hypothetical protein